MKGWLGNLLAAFRGALAAPEPWTDFDGPWSLLLLVALTLPLALSGPIRAVTSLALPWSLALALLASAGALWAVAPRLRRRALGLRAALPWGIELAGLAVVGLAVWALYIRDFGGFPNLDGWDGGSHVLIKDQFASSAPGLYNGQVGFYALAWWLERLFGIDSLRSFALSFYLAVAVTVGGPLAIAFAVVRAEAAMDRAAAAAGGVALVASSVGVLWLVVLPLLHYNQGAGYYVHVFGLLPLVMLWAVDALVRQQALRVLGLLGGFVLLRYSYALNLADAALGVAAVLAIEGFRGRWRILQGGMLVALLIAAIAIVPELRPVFLVWGGMQRFDVDLVLRADLLVVAGALLYLGLGACRGLSLAWLQTPLGRALRFPVAFALATSALMSVLRRGRGVQYYYVTKYQMWACMLLAFVAAMLLGHFAAAVVRTRGWRKPTVWLRLGVVGLLLATVPGLYATAFAGYRTSLAERVRAPGPPYRYLHALADVEALGRIKHVLAAEHKRFGGYLTGFFPMFSFMNASLGYHTGRQEFFHPDLAPGHCVFWVTRERDIYRLGPAEIVDGLRSAIATPASPCVEYPVSWKESPQSLCYRCY